MARRPTDTAHLRLRLPEGLRRNLADAAKKSNRSLNSEIVWRLMHTLTEGKEVIGQYDQVEQEIQKVISEITLVLNKTMQRLIDRRMGESK
jgi:hypothetical protein